MNKTVEEKQGSAPGKRREPVGRPELPRSHHWAAGSRAVLGAALKSRKDAQASAELAAAMLALLQDPARREVLGRGGRSLVKRCFSLESMAGDLRVYRELLAEKRAASRVVSRG